MSMLEFASSYSVVAFSLSLAGIVSIYGLAAASQITGKFRFWPPPVAKSWQHRVFLLLFRLFLYPLIALSFLEFDYSSVEPSLWRYIAGAALLITGFGLAVRITMQMGWRNAFGEKRGLCTEGWFSVSRNPVYVVTWFGLLGWGLIVGTLSVAILLALWAVMYVLAPFLEEPWLAEQYGDDYNLYKLNVPRFL